MFSNYINLLECLCNLEKRNFEGFFERGIGWNVFDGLDSCCDHFKRGGGTCQPLVRILFNSGRCTLCIWCKQQVLNCCHSRHKKTTTV